MVVELVDFVVAGDDLFDEVEVVIDVGVDAFADHPFGDVAHLRQGLRGDVVGIFAQAARRFGAVHREVADALEVGDDFEAGADDAEVSRHRLLEGEETDAVVLDAEVERIGRVVHADDAVRQRQVLLDERVHGQADHLHDEGAHSQHVVLQHRKLVLEAIPQR